MITGGASGIGLALASRFHRAGSQVAICGRRERALAAAAAALPGIATRVCDVGIATDRVALVDWMASEFPRFDVLVNNAGIQRRGPVDATTWEAAHEEIAINLEAPLHLAMLAVPHLSARASSAIVNITSGLAFAPLLIAPIYSATKAALRSLTLTLRRQLAATSVRVIEIIPPSVNTDLGGLGLHTDGAPLETFADAVWDKLRAGELQIAYGFAEQAANASRAELDAMFERMNGARERR